MKFQGIETHEGDLRDVARRRRWCSAGCSAGGSRCRRRDGRRRSVAAAADLIVAVSKTSILQTTARDTATVKVTAVDSDRATCSSGVRSSTIVPDPTAVVTLQWLRRTARRRHALPAPSAPAAISSNRAIDCRRRPLARSRRRVYGGRSRAPRCRPRPSSARAGRHVQPSSYHARPMARATAIANQPSSSSTLGGGTSQPDARPTRAAHYIVSPTPSPTSRDRAPITRDCRQASTTDSHRHRLRRAPASRRPSGTVMSASVAANPANVQRQCSPRRPTTRSTSAPCSLAPAMHRSRTCVFDSILNGDVERHRRHADVRLGLRSTPTPTALHVRPTSPGTREQRQPGTHAACLLERESISPQAPALTLPPPR